MNTKLRVLALWTFAVALASGCGLPPYSGPSGAECEPCDSACAEGLACDAGQCVDPANPNSCGAPEALCNEYCELVHDTCPHDYASRETCLGVCALLPAGDASEPVGNTIECRLHQARASLHVDERERELMCQAAGPGGDGVCGTNCESYCLLVAQACGDVLAPLTDCEAACEALGDSHRYNVGTPVAEFDHTGDTVQCRLVHVSTATVAPEPHCRHADLHSELWCIDEIPSCEAYCRVAGAACQGSEAVYPSEEACLATCALLDLGVPGNDANDSVACRTWHAKTALVDPVTHCPYAGPTGDGHCGPDGEDGFGACAPYCRVLAAACPDRFRETWESIATCRAECNESDAAFGASADQRYSVDASGATLGCRMSHAVRALVGSPEDTACDAAFGSAPCD